MQVPEVFRTRDCIILARGDTYTVAVDQAMVTNGWSGGQGVKWAVADPSTPTVTHSDGLYAGFLLWGSDESSDQYTAMTRQYPTYRYAVIGAGGWLIMTTSFEKYTWASRQGGPLVPLVYNASDRLTFSLRGYFTKEDEWTLANDPRKPNNYYIAFVAQAPRPLTKDYMTIQVSI